MKKTIALILGAVIALSATGCSKNDSDKLVVGASPAPHSLILEYAKPLLEKEGVLLEIKEFSDYALLNTALESGDIDANFFQHLPYLEKFNIENKTTLVSVGTVHFEPLSIYAGKTTSIEAIPEKAEIAIPNDATNGARALLLLEASGIIKLNGKGLESTVLDIVENTKNVQIKELEAAQIPNVLQDVDLAVINGNYAIGAGISTDKSLRSEEASADASLKFANIVAVKKNKETDEKLLTLVRILQSDDVKEFIRSEFKDSVLPTK